MYICGEKKLTENNANIDKFCRAGGYKAEPDFT